MKNFIFAAAAAASLPFTAFAAETRPNPPDLSLEQATLLRCSAAFAVVASDQDRGVQSALAYPPLKDRGKEYFVRTGAQLMDELRLSREDIQMLFTAEVGKLRSQTARAQNPALIVDAVMQPCLLSLEASGL